MDDKEEILNNMFGKHLQPKDLVADADMQALIKMDETHQEIDMLYWELGGSD